MTLLIWARFRGKNLRSRILTPFHVSFKNFRQGPADENLLTAAAKSAFKLVKLPNLRRHSSTKSWIFYRRFVLFCGVGGVRWVGEGGGGGWHFCAPTMQTSLDQLDMFSNLTSLFFAVSINIPLKINCRGSILTSRVTFEPTYFQQLVLRIWRASSGLSAFLIM